MKRRQPKGCLRGRPNRRLSTGAGRPLLSRLGWRPGGRCWPSLSYRLSCGTGAYLTACGLSALSPGADTAFHFSPGAGLSPLVLPEHRTKGCLRGRPNRRLSTGAGRPLLSRLGWRPGGRCWPSLSYRLSCGTGAYLTACGLSAVLIARQAIVLLERRRSKASG